MNDLFAEIDTSELIEAMRIYEKTTSKDAAGIVNHAAKKACFKASSKTPRAKAASINKFSPAKRRKSEYEHGLFHALAADKKNKNKIGHAVKGKGNRSVALKIYGSRKSAMGYSKAIWLTIAKEFGAKLRGSFNLKGPKGKAATTLNPTAILDAGMIEVSHLDSVMKDAMQAGVNEAAIAIRDFGLKRLQETANKFNA